MYKLYVPTPLVPFIIENQNLLLYVSTISNNTYPKGVDGDNGDKCLAVLETAYQIFSIALSAPDPFSNLSRGPSTNFAHISTEPPISYYYQVKNLFQLV